MEMNEILQWLVLLALFIGWVSNFLTIKVIRENNASNFTVIVKKFNDLDNIIEASNTTLSEEIAELQEELEIKNDEQIH